MTRRVLRTVTLVFSLTTCGYALLCASAFAQFHIIRANMFGVRTFARWHPWMFAVWLIVAVVDVVRALPGRPRAHWTFAAVWAAVGTALAIHPVLPDLGDDGRSIAVALVALAPAIWLAAADHVAAAPFLRDPRHGAADGDLDAAEGRLTIAMAATAIVVTLAFAALVPALAAGAFEPDLLTTGLSIGFVWSFAGHAVTFGAALVAAALVLRASGRSVARQYAVMLVLAGVGAAVGLDRVVSQVLGFDRLWRALLAPAMSAAIVANLGALDLRAAQDAGARLGSVLDVFGASRGGRLAPWLAGRLLLLVAAAYAAAHYSREIDWDFLFVTTVVLLLWIAAFRVILRVSPARPVGGAALAAIAVVPLILSLGVRRVEARYPSTELALRRYIVYNPSYRLTERLMPGRGGAAVPAFERFLRDNATLGRADIKPVDLEFVSPLGPAPRQPAPNVFLFVIDSLRRDYLAPYNAAVTFTPSLQRFAAESVVFRNAMTRYGATGLSLPSIWSGAVGVHRQYVMPFWPMNTLEKLLVANRFRRVMSIDVLMTPLLRPWSDTIALDRGRSTLDYDLCRTLGELETHLSDDGGGAAAPPIFGYSLPQNLHLSNLVNASVPAGEHYPGFHAPYATRVRDVDRCFGAFVDILKARGLYDRSVIVVTADHGELLGEEGRWGHAYYLFPQILEIPLIVHLPAAARDLPPADVGALSFTTDIAPTIYAALGYRPRAANALMGDPLIGATRVDAYARRRADFAVEASYSAVFGAVRRNGRRVYIVDAISGNEYAYDRDRAGRWSAIAVTDAVRSAGQRIIREHVDEVRRIYRLAPYGGTG